MNPDGTVACVTGGANGLGLEIARRLSEQGAITVVLDRDTSALSALSPELAAREVDLTDLSAVQDAVHSVIEELGPIRILVNNAGVIRSAPMVNILNPEQMMHSVSGFEDCLRDNLLTTFISTTAVVEQMVRRRQKGVVVNVSSISARGNAGQSAYSAAKAAINALTIVWSKEWGRLGIRCNAVAPGFFDSASTRRALPESAIDDLIKRTPVSRLGQGSEIAEAVEFLVRNDFVNGAILDVNGGLVL